MLSHTSSKGLRQIIKGSKEGSINNESKIDNTFTLVILTSLPCILTGLSLHFQFSCHYIHCPLLILKDIYIALVTT